MPPTTFADDAKNEMKDRLTSSVPSSLILSFLMWNWPLLLILTYGEAAPSERVLQIKKYFYETDAWTEVVCPLITAIFYVVCMPVLKYLYETQWTLRVSKWQAEKNFLVKKELEDFEKLRTSLEAFALHLRNDLAKAEVQLRSLAQKGLNHIKTPTEATRNELKATADASVTIAAELKNRIGELKTHWFPDAEKESRNNCLVALVKEKRKYIPSWLS